MTPVIDFHTHVFPDHSAAHIIKALQKKAPWEPFTDGTVNGLRTSMKKSKITASVQLPIATRVDQVTAINNFVLKINSPEIISFGALHPKDKNFKNELDRLARAGVKGIKLHPEYQQFYPDDAFMFPVYEELLQRNMIVFFHAGRDIAFSEVHGTPERFAKVIKLFPRLKIVLAHLGGFQMWEDVEKELLGKDIYLDTSFALGYMTGENFGEFLKRHNPEYILFGTDSPWRDQGQEIEKLKTIIDDKKIMEKITYANAKKLLRL